MPYGLVAIAGLALASMGAGLAREPAFVDRVDVLNRSPYDLSVEVRGAADEGWVPLGYVARDETTAVSEVLDQGSRWTFRFTGQGRDAGTFTMTRVQLAEAGWRFKVPSEVGATLHEAGAPASP